MKVISIGSCYSNLTSNALRKYFGFEHLNNVAHNRSDALNDYFFSKSKKQLPLEYFDNLVSIEGKEEISKTFLNNQYPKGLGTHEKPDAGDFFENIKTADVIICDNYMDIAARLMLPKNLEAYKNSPVFLNTGYFSNISDHFEIGDYISTAEALHNWREVILKIKEINPNSSIFYLPFPYNTSESNPERYRRARDFVEAADLLASSALARVIKPFDIRDTDIKDWAHYQERIYISIAGRIFSQLY